MIHHYLQRGFTFEYILSRTFTEKQFMIASINLFNEEEAKKFRALTGGEV